MGVKIKCCQLGTTLLHIFRSPHDSCCEKKKSFEHFLLVQQCYKTAKIPYVTLQVGSKLFPLTLTEAGIFWELVAVCVFYVDSQAVPVYTHSIQSYRSDKQLCVIKVYIHPRRLILTGAAFSLELNPVTHPDSCPLTVVCSSFCCRS